jgi:hypothetical protein
MVIELFKGVLPSQASLKGFEKEDFDFGTLPNREIRRNTAELRF